MLFISQSISFFSVYSIKKKKIIIACVEWWMMNAILDLFHVQHFHFGHDIFNIWDYCCFYPPHYHHFVPAYKQFENLNEALSIHVSFLSNMAKSFSIRFLAGLMWWSLITDHRIYWIVNQINTNNTSQMNCHLSSNRKWILKFLINICFIRIHFIQVRCVISFKFSSKRHNSEGSVKYKIEKKFLSLFFTMLRLKMDQWVFVKTFFSFAFVEYSFFPRV